MKTPAVSALMIILLGTAVLGQTVRAQETLPQYITIELKRVEETWQILDSISTKIWPGWTGHADVPFLFTYPNGVQLLVGYPQPPEGFVLIPEFTAKGKKAYLDRTKEIQLEMPLPMNGGGGPQPYGVVDGKRVTVVMIHSRSLALEAEKAGMKPRPDDFALGSENQILLNIHELFHCFQAGFKHHLSHGNLRFNTDENYATFAEIEGLALERAWFETDEKLGKEYLKDFVVARDQKRKSMNETERLQESEEDVAEGTATFTQFMTPMLLGNSFPYLLWQKDDPYFFGFRYADSLKQQELGRLRATGSSSLTSTDKCYSFGCFQAVLLTRMSPDWRTGFFEQGKFLDQTIDSLLSMSPEERGIVAGRVKSRYGYDTIYARHAAVIGERDQAYEMIQKRKGVAFIVNFKNTGEFPSPEANGKVSSVGLTYIFPKGIKRIRIADALFEGKETPMVQDQIYYVKWIDTDAKEGEKRYEVKGDREGDTWKNAVFKTAGFTLSAPKIEVKESKDRVKVTVQEKKKQ